MHSLSSKPIDSFSFYFLQCYCSEVVQFWQCSVISASIIVPSGVPRATPTIWR